MDNMTKKLVSSVESSLRRNSDKTTETSKQLNNFKKSVGEETEIDEKWSQKYKSSIDCSNPKGFSQKAHCQGKKKESKEEIEKEVDEDLRESFVTQRNKITEMFQRFNKYN